MLESAIIGFFSSFAATFFYELAEKGKQQINADHAYNKLLKEALRQATDFILQEDLSLQDFRNQIVDLIWESRCDHQIIENRSLVAAISILLDQAEETNLTAEELITRIISALPSKISLNPQLSLCVTMEMLQGLRNLDKKILESLNVVTLELQEAKKPKLQRAYYDINKGVFRVLSQRGNRVVNNRFLPESYKNYFVRSLFLEKNLADGKEATLLDTYIMPKFQVMDFKLGNEGRTFSDIKQFIIDFANNNLKSHNYGTKYSCPSDEINTLFIKGHPGSGKSSLFFFLAYQKSNFNDFLPERQLYFIRLVELLLVNSNKLSEDNPLGDIVKHLQINPEKLADAVIVLDGLDEICGLKDIDIDVYCRNLISSSCFYTGLKIIITTRQNYINIKNLDNKNVINISLACLSIDDLKEWARNYFNIHDKCSEQRKVTQNNLDLLKSLEEDSDKSLVPIVAIPLLFYMVVAMNIDLSRISNIGELYDGVFDELIDRNYNDNAVDAIQTHPIKTKINPQLARQITREIAFMMYKRNTLLLKVSDKELRTALEEAIDEFQKDHMILESSEKSQIEKLFAITFFYKQAEDIVEFAHKSIMEYFTAEKLFTSLQKCGTSAVDFIFKEFIDQPISIEVANFLRDAFARKQLPEGVYEQLRLQVSRYYLSITIDGDLRNISCDKGVFSFDYGKYVQRVFWFFVRDVFKDIETVNLYLSNDNAKTLLRNLIVTKSSSDSGFLDLCANPINLSRCILKEFDFSFCKISCMDFDGSDLLTVNFSHSSLDKCNFTECYFSNVVFSNSSVRNSLISCQRSNSTLDFTNAVIEDVKFLNMDFTKILFEYTRFISVIFENPYLNLAQLTDFCERGIEIITPKVQVQYQNIPESIIKQAFKQGKNEREILSHIKRIFEPEVKELIANFTSTNTSSIIIDFDNEDIFAGVKKTMNK